jgi:hypothetical protein
MKNKTKQRLARKSKLWNRIIANHIFVDYVNERPLEETIKRIELHSGVIKKYRAYIDLQMQKINKAYGWEHKPDTRSGVESYGYKSIEHVKGNLNYISDRFSVGFRLTWMLDLPSHIEGLPETHSTEE